MAAAILCSFLFFIKQSLIQPLCRALFCVPRPQRLRRRG